MPCNVDAVAGRLAGRTVAARGATAAWADSNFSRVGEWAAPTLNRDTEPVRMGPDGLLAGLLALGWLALAMVAASTVMPTATVAAAASARCMGLTSSDRRISTSKYAYYFCPTVGRRLGSPFLRSSFRAPAPTSPHAGVPGRL